MKLIEVGEKERNLGIEIILGSDSLSKHQLIDIGKQLMRDTGSIQSRNSKRYYELTGNVLIIGEYRSNNEVQQAHDEIKRKVRRLSRQPNFPWRLVTIGYTWK